jgi:hypothetical protein
MCFVCLVYVVELSYVYINFKQTQSSKTSNCHDIFSVKILEIQSEKGY